MIHIERKVCDFGILFEITGSIEYGNVEQLKTEYNKLEGKKISRLIFNLSDVTYMDSSGIGMLVSFANLVNKQDGRVALIGMKQEIKKNLQSTKLLTLFEEFDDMDSLEKAFQ